MAQTFNVGDKAPPFSAASTEGKEVSLASLKGQAVVLYFYPKDSTPGCTREACDFRDLHKEFEEAGARIYGVSKDSLRSHENFIRKQSLPFPLLSDPDLELQQAYGVWVEKKNYGRTYMGTERSTFLIDTRGKIAAVWRKVRVKGHVEEVLEAVRALK